MTPARVARFWDGTPRGAAGSWASQLRRLGGLQVGDSHAELRQCRPPCLRDALWSAIVAVLRLPAVVLGHLHRVLTAYVARYNTARPHRSLDLDVPMPAPIASLTTLPASRRVERIDVLGGLIHEYRRAA